MKLRSSLYLDALLTGSDRELRGRNVLLERGDKDFPGVQMATSLTTVKARGDRDRQRTVMTTITNFSNFEVGLQKGTIIGWAMKMKPDTEIAMTWGEVDCETSQDEESKELPK